MNTRAVRNLVNVFMQSPIYPTLTRKERRDLVTRFISLYSDLRDLPQASDPEKNNPRDRGRRNRRDRTSSSL